MLAYKPSAADVPCRVAALEKAEAEKVQVVKAAEADSEAKYLQGQGIARQRQAIVNGLRESVLNFERAPLYVALPAAAVDLTVSVGVLSQLALSDKTSPTQVSACQVCH